MTEPFLAPPVDELDDDDFVLPPARGRVPRLTAALGVLLVAGVAFLGGALTQKHTGSTAGSNASLRAGRTGTAGSGTFGAGTLGAGTFGEGFPAGGFGAAAPGGGAAAASPTGPSPLAIGTVVSSTASTVVIKDLGGHTRTIPLAAGVTVTTSGLLKAGDLTPGQNVTVSGTTAADGTATATTIARR